MQSIHFWRFVRRPEAFIGGLAGLLVIIGLMAEKSRAPWSGAVLAWTGVALLCVFAVLFILGIGMLYGPLALLLLVLLLLSEVGLGSPKGG
jgi:hypothetical protein